MSIRIGSISSVGHAENFAIVPDDRQSLVKVIGGVVVEDYGVCADGEIFSLTANFSASDYLTLLNYWTNRTLVNVVFDDGRTVNNARIVIRGISYFDNIQNQYKKVQFEVWKK